MLNKSYDHKNITCVQNFLFFTKKIFTQKYDNMFNIFRVTFLNATPKINIFQKLRLGVHSCIFSCAHGGNMWFKPKFLIIISHRAEQVHSKFYLIF